MYETQECTRGGVMEGRKCQRIGDVKLWIPRSGLRRFVLDGMFCGTVLIMSVVVELPALHCTSADVQFGDDLILPKCVTKPPITSESVYWCRSKKSIAFSSPLID